METLYQVAERHKLPKPAPMKEPKTGENYGIEANAYEQIKKLYERSRLGQKYQPISLEFLGLKDEKGFPKFAVYSLQKSSCRIHLKTGAFSGGWDLLVRERDDEETNIPDFCYTHMKKTTAEIFKKHLHPKLRGFFGSLKSGTEATMTLTQEFMSVIPQETKEKIAEAKKDVPYTAIISESAGWAVNETVRKLPKNPDPLVVGWSYTAKQSYLIDSFDMTSMEQWIAKEFTE